MPRTRKVTEVHVSEYALFALSPVVTSLFFAHALQLCNSALSSWLDPQFGVGFPSELPSLHRDSSTAVFTVLKTVRFRRDWAGIASE